MSVWQLETSEVACSTVVVSCINFCKSLNIIVKIQVITCVGGVLAQFLTRTIRLEMFF